MHFTQLTRLLIVSISLGIACLHAAEKPNIIFILADDMGYGDAGFNGQTKIETPHLDRMAKEGATFTDFYAGAPVCGPSRAALLYGQHAGLNPIRGNPRWTLSGKKPEMSKDDILISHELKRAGYATAVFGKWGMNEVFTDKSTGDGVGHPLRQGFDEFVGFNTHVEAHWHWPDYYWDGYEKVLLVPDDQLRKKANFRKRQTYADDVFQQKCLEYIERKAGKEPFFIYMNYTIPHLGHTVPKDSSDYYKSRGWPEKKGWTDYYEMDQELHTTYAGMITRMDGYIGQILQKLHDTGIAQNTLVIFTSDNGHEANYPLFDSNGPLRGKKRDLTEGGIRAPTVATWPSTIQPGTQISTPLAFWDVLPTLAEIAGITPQAQTNGLSFYPALRGQHHKQPQHQALYWEFNEFDGPKQAIRFGNYKALRQWDNAIKQIGPIQLYDLSKDIGEANNIANEHPELVEQAQQLFNQSRTEHPEWPLTLREAAKRKLEERERNKAKN